MICMNLHDLYDRYDLHNLYDLYDPYDLCDLYDLYDLDRDQSEVCNQSCQIAHVDSTCGHGLTVHNSEVKNLRSYIFPFFYGERPTFALIL